MMTIIQLIVLVVGLIMYMISSNPKLVEVGRMMFWTGILSFLLSGFHVAIPHY